MSTRSKIGVVLLQLGTPDAPTPEALRRYLREFLSDRRVIDLPRALWLPILYLRVLRTRPSQSARLYQKVWTSEGSPLAATTAAQAAGVRERLGDTFEDEVVVAHAMRYGNPSTLSVIDGLIAQGCDRLLAVPMYPQYASATTGSSIEEVLRVIGSRRVVPSLRVVPPYFDDPLYIDALGAVTRDALSEWEPDHVVMSFHGLPKRYAALGDPYPDHCLATARALAAREAWPADFFTVSFQSRFGREEWLRPYTDETLAVLGRRKLSRLAVLCPGFTSDCLETIEEIGMTGREQYAHAGGGDYRLVPCLNADPRWLDALTAMVSRELRGWHGAR